MGVYTSVPGDGLLMAMGPHKTLLTENTVQYGFQTEVGIEGYFVYNAPNLLETTIENENVGFGQLNLPMLEINDSL